MTVEVTLKIVFPDHTHPRILKEAEERGLGYGDPGKILLTRRLAADAVHEAFGECLGKGGHEDVSVSIANG